MRQNQPKIEAPQDWDKAVNYIPKKNQIIIYDGIKCKDDYVSMPRLKIGDGIHTVSELPFENDNKISYIKDEEILIIN